MLLYGSGCAAAGVAAAIAIAPNTAMPARHRRANWLRRNRASTALRSIISSEVFGCFARRAPRRVGTVRSLGERSFEADRCPVEAIGRRSTEYDAIIGP